MKAKALLSVPATAFVAALLAFGCSEATSAENAARPAGKPALDPPTTVALGVSWLIKGDADKDAVVTLEYREVTDDNDAKWQKAWPLLRAEDGNAPKHIKSARSYFFKVGVPRGTWRFAGSVWNLEPDTEYELRLRLKDPDGGKAEEVLRASTRAVPPRVGGGRELYVVPGNGGGSGTKADPFKGLKAAQKNAQPGDTFYLLPGVYKGVFEITKSGEAGKPIVWRAAPLDKGGKLDKNGKPEEVILDSGGAGSVVVANTSDFVTLDGLTIRNGRMGIQANGAGDLTVRWCRILKVRNGIYAKHPRAHPVQNFYVADNYIEGPSVWPRSKGIEDTGGIDLAGQGHVVCHNRIKGVADGMSVCRSPKNFAMDFYENEISECTDDGIEADYSNYNVRVYRNRLTNVYQAISCQPARGGPVYIFRNAIYNVGGNAETFKLHNYTSGVLIVHNSSFKKGTTLHVGTRETAHNVHFYNNLFTGKGKGKGLAVNFGQPLENCSFDYNGIVGTGFNGYMRWNRGPWLSLKKLRKEGPVQKHGFYFPLEKNNIHASGLQPPEKVAEKFPPEKNDQRLKDGSPAVDKGLPMPGFNDGFKGKAPDLGAYELGDPLPHYGPRPDPARTKKTDKKG